MDNFNHKEIEKKWQAAWEKEKIYQASDSGKKKYVLIEFPYPSGEGLHMGHLRPYLAGDIYSRFNRMQGYETLFPIGWDAFGLPAENFAIKKGVHPSVSTAKNVANAKKQLQSWGMGFDWSREVNTTDSEYYKWTQWIFLQFFKAGLAYEATGLINWCPKDKTGLANEEVIDGKCERCGTAVEKKEMKQWYLKITAYAEKLLEGLKTLSWPEQVKVQQENWIGKSEGAEIDFEVDTIGSKQTLVIHGVMGHSKENWFPWLKKNLEKQNWDVSIPDMPNADHPVVEEWDSVINKELKENAVVIGHSLGAPAAINSIQNANKKISKLILVAPVNPNQKWSYLKKEFSGVDWDAVKNFADIKFDWKKIEKLVDQIVVYYSDNDPYVPKESIDFYKKHLPNAVFKFMSGKQHFSASAGGITEFPEVLEAIISKIKIFTTRPDTLFGATYMVLAPEHPLVEQITTSEQRSYVTSYVTKTSAKTDMQRTAVEKEKTGVFTGSFAINPATKEKIPVWIADYVLASYGTGAIMAVPAHDERDMAFAKKYKLPIRQVVKPEPLASRVLNARDKAAGMKEDIELVSDLWTGEGILINSGDFNGIETQKARWEITKSVGGQKKVQYKLRDWVFSRQRYWGEPIPLIHCEKCGTVAVPEDQLPVKLPEVEKYEPTGTGESPLAAIDSWVNVKCSNCEEPAKRETNTMPQWAGSSWYWLRYTDPKNDKALASKKLLEHWTPVDVYFGGMEHTTLHLLYSRFWNLFLYDQGVVTAPEPYLRRIPHGIILGPDNEKMSKSRGNVVNPDDIVAQYGADVLRMYEPFLGPHEATVPWNDKGIVGIKRFLDRVWRIGNGPFSQIERGNNIHKLIIKITSDIENFKFNTAIAAFMEFLNENKELSKNNFEIFLILLAPFAPHISEELWNILGHKGSVHVQSWPKADASLVEDVMVKVIVQISGRVRATLEVNRGSAQASVTNEAKQDPNVKKHLEGKEIVKEIFVQDKLINFVIK
jgi:leucyl-tRNA synthetase